MYLAARSLAACSLVVVACGGAPAPAPVLQGQADPAPPARATPAPSIAWQGSRFATHGLPAVAREGEVAVFAVIDSDGGRGYPNLRLEVHDRGDKLLQTVPVMTSNEFEALAPGGVPGPVLRRRIADANHALDTLHGVHDLVAMHPLEVAQPPDGGLPHLAMGDGLDVDFAGDHVSVFVHDTDRSLAYRASSAWQVAPHRSCARCEMCENPAFLAAVYHATGIDAVVVEIGYKGTDICWEPGNQLHVIGW